MSLLSTSPLRRAWMALAVAALAALAFATSASASTATGEVTLTLKKGAKSSLLREGVKVTPGSGKGKTRTVKAAVADLDLTTKTVSSGTVLTFSAKGKSVKLRELQLKAGPKSTALSAKHGGKRTVFFRIQGAPQELGTALSAKGALALTGDGAKALRGALGLEGISSGKAGSGSFAATISELKPVPPAPDKPKEEEKPQGEPYPYEAQCPVVKTSQPASPITKVASIGALPTFEPGTEQELTGGATDWGFKSGFRSYVLVVDSVNAPGSLQTLDGAEASAPGMGMLAPDAYFEFPTTGDYEAGTEQDHSDDKLVAEGTGTVLFCKSGHGFNVVLKNPTVVIDGENSRIVAETSANLNGTWYPLQKVDIATLDLDAVEPELSDGGNTIVWEDIPAKLTADGAQATGLSGFYSANEELDPITVEGSLDRPLLSQCTLAAGTVETPPAVDFTLPALPTLASPVVRSGENIGTINWGFRRATRSTTVSGAEPSTNAFQLLGGATEGYPGNMGGGASAPPTGGIGKFFRFPVSSYEYEAGTADPKDDRLIATSDATVGFCNVKFGGFGIVISKPTLIIDNGNSRLVANAYSYAGPFGMGAAKGWIGGRVVLVNLDSSGTDAVATTGAVTWGQVTADNTPLETGIPIEITEEKGLRTEALSLASLTEASTKTGGFDPVAAQIALPPAP